MPEQNSMKIGDRVGAVSGNMPTGVVEIFGFGVYEGKHPVDPLAVGYIANIHRAAGTKSHRIRLDSGETIYGCECWFDHEDRVKAKLASFRTAEITVAEARAEQRGEAAQA